MKVELGDQAEDAKKCKNEVCRAEAKLGGYCPSCAAKRANSARWGKEGRARGPQKAPESRPPIKDPALIKGAVIAVDFTGREEILEAVRTQAQEEVRSVEEQIVWIVKVTVCRG